MHMSGRTLSACTLEDRSVDGCSSQEVAELLGNRPRQQTVQPNKPNQILNGYTLGLVAGRVARAAHTQSGSLTASPGEHLPARQLSSVWGNPSGLLQELAQAMRQHTWRGMRMMSAVPCMSLGQGPHHQAGS
jgi:hypothetical protein